MFELEARNKKKSALLFAVISSILPASFVYNNYEKFTKWEFPKGGFVGLVFSFLFAAIALYWWLKLLDSSVQIGISKRGITYNKFLIPFSPKNFAKFSEIEYFYLRIEQRKGFTGYFLIIGFKSAIRKEKKIEIIGLDKSKDEIISAISYHARFNGIRNSGTTDILQ